MTPDLHLDPDVVHRLAGSARRTAGDLDSAVPEPDGDAADDLVRAVHRVTAELAAFAGAAGSAARRARDTDRDAATALYRSGRARP